MGKWHLQCTNKFCGKAVTSTNRGEARREQGICQSGNAAPSMQAVHSVAGASFVLRKKFAAQTSHSLLPAAELCPFGQAMHSPSFKYIPFGQPHSPVQQQGPHALLRCYRNAIIIGVRDASEPVWQVSLGYSGLINTKTSHLREAGQFGRLLDRLLAYLGSPPLCRCLARRVGSVCRVC